MISIGEAIQRLESLYNRGVQSKDTRLTSRHIYSALITARATLIKQQSNKSQHINAWIYQSLPCVQLIQVNSSECVGAPKGVTVLRSKYKIPKLVSDMDGELISSVTNVNGDSTYSSSTYDTVRYYTGSKYTSKTVRYYVKDGYFYMANTMILKMIAVDRGVFEDPLEVWQYNLANGWCPECKCVPAYDIEFPIDRDLMRTVLELAQQELIVMFSQMTEDTEANAADDTRGGRGAMIHQPQQQQEA